MTNALATVACLATGLNKGGLDAAAKRALILGFGWHRLGYQHTAAIRARLAEGCSPATANKALSALRGVLKEAWRLGHLPSEVYHRAVDLPGVKAETLPAGRMLTSGEVTALVEACQADSSPTGARDTALLAVLYSGGVRRAEAVTVDLDDYDPETGELRVHGKRRKDRIVYAASGAREALAVWLAVRGDDHGPLLWPTGKGHRLIARRMTPQSVLDILRF